MLGNANNDIAHRATNQSFVYRQFHLIARQLTSVAIRVRIEAVVVVLPASVFCGVLAVTYAA